MIRLLLVDDEYSMIEGLRKYIPWPDLGIGDVMAEVDPAKALSLALRLKPDILMTDIRMPKMDGIQLAKKVREKLPQCSILFLTAFNEKEYLKSAISLRAVDYLEKPVDRDELCAVVRKLAAEIHERGERLSENRREELALRFSKALPEEERRRILELYGLDGALPCVYAYIKTDSHSETVLPAAVRNDLLGRISALFESPGCNAYATMKQSDGFALLLAGKSIPEDVFCGSEIGGIEQILSESFGKPVKAFAGVGSRLALREADESYRQAAQCAQRYFFLGYGRILRWDGLRSVNFNPDGMLREFDRKLKMFDRAPVLQFIRDAVAEMRRDGGLSIQTVKNLFFRMLVSLENLEKSLASHYAEENLWDKVESMDTLEVFKTYLVDKVTKIIPAEPDMVSQYVSSIKKVIEDNYSRSEFSLESIARSVHLSLQYICRIFKETTGETVNNYIVSVRIGKAKELLRKEGLRLADVASSVGYKSPNHFAKVFREIEGVNPSVFRALAQHRAEQNHNSLH